MNELLPRERWPGFALMMEKITPTSHAFQTPGVMTSLGRKISGISIANNDLEISFDDCPPVRIHDTGQSCCETRYLATDDNLEEFTGSLLHGIELSEIRELEEGGGGCTEISFIRIHTGKGTCVVKCYNEHNGYYGGFSVQVISG